MTERPKAIDRSVKLTPMAGVDLQSFYRTRSQSSAAGPEDSEHQLWGVKAASAVPVFDATAQFEYSVWMPEGSNQKGFENDSNRLVRLRLEDSVRRVDYGVRLFSVGDAFAGNPVARERLRATGLPGAGTGNEVWARSRLPWLSLEPSVRRGERRDGDVRIIDETYRVSLEQDLWWDTRFASAVESFAALTEGENGAGFLKARDGSSAKVELNGGFWSASVKGSRSLTSFAESEAREESAWELGAVIDLSAALTLAPVLKEQARHVGETEALTLQTAGLDIRTDWAGLPQMRLHLEHKHGEGAEGDLAGFGAKLSLRTPIRLWERFAPKVTMDASVQYQTLEGSLAERQEDGLGFRVTLEYQAEG